MSAAIRITIPPSGASDDVHQFRNFGEAVYLALRNTCSVSIDEIDAATNSLVVRDIRRSDLGTVTQTVRKALNKHGLGASATIERL